MDGAKSDETKPIAMLAAAGALLQWIAQPPLSMWLVAFIALVPWLMIVQRTTITRRGCWMIWLAGFVYWLFTLQGLRHAHPIIYLGWLALAAYLSVYGVLFVIICRRMLARKIPLWISAPITWVGLECVRNYFVGGISAAMLGHTLADVPIMIQVADTFGSYGVSFALAGMNVALFEAWLTFRGKRTRAETFVPRFVGFVLLVATLGYGYYRLNQPTTDSLATFALIQRSEQVEYVLDEARDAEIFGNYARQTLTAISSAPVDVDAVVWPESMFSGGAPWRIADEGAKPPPQSGMTAAELIEGVQYNRRYVIERSRDLQDAMANSRPSRKTPHLIGGSGVYHYRNMPHSYSGVLHVTSDGNVADWYGKTHLVMFGEYVPVLPWIPGVRSLIPPGMGLSTGPGPKRFQVGDTTVSPNICIETAVERVTLNQMSLLKSRSEMPDVIVTVTNDGWFDDSSVIDHHLRCAQLVAVGCRRPILSAANNGPTAWIDSHGSIVQRLATGSEGSIIATPKRDDRISLYVRIGDWPAKLLGLICLLVLAELSWNGWRKRQRQRDEDAEPSGEPLGTLET